MDSEGVGQTVLISSEFNCPHKGLRSFCQISPRLVIRTLLKLPHDVYTETPKYGFGKHKLSQYAALEDNYEAMYRFKRENYN